MCDEEDAAQAKTSFVEMSYWERVWFTLIIGIIGLGVIVASLVALGCGLRILDIADHAPHNRMAQGFDALTDAASMWTLAVIAFLATFTATRLLYELMKLLADAFSDLYGKFTGIFQHSSPHLAEYCPKAEFEDASVLTA